MMGMGMGTAMGVEEWRSGGVEEWRSGGVEEWRSGGVETGFRIGNVSARVEMSGIVWSMVGLGFSDPRERGYVTLIERLSRRVFVMR
jgi:hypothetical protein